MTDERLRVSVWVRNGQTLHSFVAGPGSGFLVSLALVRFAVARVGSLPEKLRVEHQLVSHRFCYRYTSLFRQSKTEHARPG